jgi:hypothetical protein
MNLKGWVKSKNADVEIIPVSKSLREATAAHEELVAGGAV